MGLSKQLTSAVLAVSLLAGLAGPASAAYPDGVEAAARRMHDLGLIQGRDPNNPDDLALNGNITRAELVTVIVRAFGQRAAAGQLKGVPAFPDSASHWASGEIAMAKSLIESNGFTLGMPDGTFQPDYPVTTAEAVAFVVKFLGLSYNKKEIWPDNFFNAAVAAGILSAAERDEFAPSSFRAAKRGLVFYLMDNAFYTIKLPSGKTVYTRYVKPIPPVLNVNPVPPTTAESQITVTGQVSTDAVSVYVNTVKATVTPQGKYSATVPADIGSITVTATDLAGNVVAQVAKKNTVAGDQPAFIEAPPALTVGAGETVDLPVTVRDAKGNDMKNVPFTVTTDLGTYNAGKFLANTKSGSGLAVVRAGGVSVIVNVTVKPGKLARLAVTPATTQLATGGTQQFSAAAFDQYDNPVEPNATIGWSSSRGIINVDGLFAAVADVSGSVTITATAGGLSGTAQVNVFGIASRIVVAAPTGLVANGVSHGALTVSIQDSGGNVVKGYDGKLDVRSTLTDTADISSRIISVTDGKGTVDVLAGNVSGTAYIIVTGPDLPGVTTVVNVVEPVPTSLKLTADPSPLSADGRSVATVTAVLMDQTGYPLQSAPSGTWSVDFTSSNATVLSPAQRTGVGLAVDGEEGAYLTTAEFASGRVPGTATISAVVTRNGQPAAVTADPVTVNTVLVGPPVRLAMDPIRDTRSAGPKNTVQKVVVRILDSNGYQVTQAGSDPTSPYPISNLMLVANPGSAAAVPQPLNGTNAGVWGNGKAVFRVTDTRAELVAYTASASAGSTQLEIGSAVGIFRPGPVGRILLVADPPVLSSTTGGSGALTAKLADLNGNLVADGSYAVGFRRFTGPPYAALNWTDATIHSAGGVAVVAMTASLGAGADQFTAEATLANGTRVISEPVMVTTTEVVGAAKQLRFASSPPIVSGADVAIKVMIYDENGALVVSYDNSTTVTLNVQDPAKAQKTYSAKAVNGIATFPFNFTLTGSYTLKATAPGMKGATSTKDNGAATQVVTAGPPKGLKISTNARNLAADNISTALMTITLVDAYGNQTDSSEAFNLDGLTFTTSNGAVAAPVGTEPTYYRFDGQTVAVAPAGKAIARMTFKAGSVPGVTVVTAWKSGFDQGSYSLTTFFGGFTASGLNVVVDAPAKVTVDPTDKQLQKVVVDLIDSQGQRVTNPGAGNYFARLTATGSPNVTAYLDNGGNPTVYDDSNRPQFTQQNAGEVVFYVTDDKAETVTYRAELYNARSGGSPVISVAGNSADGTFLNNAPYQIGLKAQPKVMRGDGKNQAAVTAVVEDRNGNPVVDVDGILKLQLRGDTSTSHASITGADADGWFAAAVKEGLVSTTVKTRIVDTTADVLMAAEFWADGADQPAVSLLPVRVFSVGSNTDNTAPTIASIVVTRALNGWVLAGDRIVFTFTEKTNTPDLKPSDFVLPAGKSLGDAKLSWDATGTQLTMIAGRGVNLAHGDNVKFSASDKVTDYSQNGFGRGTLFTVDVIAPIPTVSVTRQVAGAVTPGDTFTVQFSEPVKSGPLLNESFNITPSGTDHTLGFGSAFAWDQSHTVLTITLGTGSNLAANDVITFAAATTVTDMVGNGAGVAPLYKIDLSTVVVTNVNVNRVRNGRYLAGDSVVITFSRSTSAPTLAPADFIISGGHNFGTGATFTWDVTKTVLTIRGGGVPTVVDGDIVRLAQGSKIKDSGGNGYGIGTLIKLDTTAPLAKNVSVTRFANRQFKQGDTLTVTFNEATNGPNLAGSSFVINGGHGFGIGATFKWDALKTVLTIIGGANPTLADGDSIAFTSGGIVKDSSGNTFGTGVFAVIDLTGPVVTGVNVNRSRNKAFQEGDSIIFLFSETTNMPQLSATDFAVGNGHSFGTGATFNWGADGASLTITGGAAATLANGDTLAMAAPSTITDYSGNGLGAGTFWTVDLGAPMVTQVIVRRAVNNAFARGDIIRLTFDKPTTAPDLLATDFAITGGHDFGTGATFRWDASHTELTITGAGIPTLQTGDAVSFTSPNTVRDALGNGVGTEPIFHADLTAPAVAGVAVQPTGGAADNTIATGDQIVVTFTKRIVTPPQLHASDFTITGDHSMGDDAVITWNPEGTQLTITIGTVNLNLAGGDTITLKPSTGAILRDDVGNPVGGIDLYKVVQSSF
ncbi:MAG TPA: S-layer homology domain-containing protein [Symbiobacteriaceae bacterium]